MIYLPSARRLLCPAISFLALVALFHGFTNPRIGAHKLILEAHVAANIREGTYLVLPLFENGTSSINDANTDDQSQEHESLSVPSWKLFVNSPAPVSNPRFDSFQKCPLKPNQVTHHVRLPNVLRNISLVAPSQAGSDTRYFNPAIIPLPQWSGQSKYLLISRVVTTGLHQESHVCLADICSPSSSGPLPPDVRPCTDDDLVQLGPGGGLRCTSAPVQINIPPTPAAQCSGPWSAFPDIPGFHDPRAFWSGSGEPLILVNSASQYGCVGLWLMDLRPLYPALETLLNRHGQGTSQQIMKYPHLTELTRNPRRSRASVEKNWILWFPNRADAFVQYELAPPALLTANSTNALPSGGGRTFAKLTGNGFTSPNLTWSSEPPCFAAEHARDHLGNLGRWHQGSNTLRLVLCTRAEARARGGCAVEADSVHFSVVHRKFSNEMDLPLRYERYMYVWEGRAPYRVLGVSRHPLLMWEEKAEPWSEAENWALEEGGNATWMFGWNRFRENKRHDGQEGRMSTAYFTYTPSLAWVWKPHAARAFHGNNEEEQDDVEVLSRLGIGYLGDEVLMGIGLEDTDQAFARVKVDDLLACLRVCPGINIDGEKASDE